MTAFRDLAFAQFGVRQDLADAPPSQHDDAPRQYPIDIVTISKLWRTNSVVWGSSGTAAAKKLD